MSRLPDPIGFTLLHLSVPKDLRERLNNHLCQRTDGKIRKGEYGRFLLPLIDEELKRLGK